MNFNFSPSLEHMTAVEIAQRLYYDKDIQRMLEEEWNVRCSACCFDSEENELWKQIKKTAAEKLPSLPDCLKAKLSKFIRPFQGEAEKWSWDHKRLLGLSVTGCYLTYKSILCWKADGTIDRMQTARKLAQDRNIDTATRFAVACTYFLEHEVLTLWHGNEVRLSQTRKNAAVRFWIKYLKKGTWRNRNWKAMADRYFKISRFRRSDSRLRVSSFFPYLSWEGKKKYFLYLRENRVHSDDYRLCWQAMNEIERMEMISTYFDICLLDILEWPFQSLFMETVNQLWSHMDTILFQALLHYFIIFRIFQGLDDFDYVKLFKEFWHNSPAPFKNAINENGKLFELIKMTLNYDERKTTLSLPETMYDTVRQYYVCQCA